MTRHYDTGVVWAMAALAALPENAGIEDELGQPLAEYARLYAAAWHCPYVPSEMLSVCETPGRIEVATTSRGEPAVPPGSLCEQCLDAMAVTLAPAPWGGEMGVCEACQRATALLGNLPPLCACGRLITSDHPRCLLDAETPAVQRRRATEARWLKEQALEWRLLVEHRDTRAAFWERERRACHFSRLVDVTEDGRIVARQEEQLAQAQETPDDPA